MTPQEIKDAFFHDLQLRPNKIWEWKYLPAWIETHVAEVLPTSTTSYTRYFFFGFTRSNMLFCSCEYTLQGIKGWDKFLQLTPIWEEGGEKVEDYSWILNDLKGKGENPPIKIWELAKYINLLPYTTDWLFMYQTSNGVIHFYSTDYSKCGLHEICYGPSSRTHKDFSRIIQSPPIWQERTITQQQSKVVLKPTYCKYAKPQETGYSETVQLYIINKAGNKVPLYSDTEQTVRDVEKCLKVKVVRYAREWPYCNFVDKPVDIIYDKEEKSGKDSYTLTARFHCPFCQQKRDKDIPF